MQDYCGVFSLAITKVAHQLLKSKQNVVKTKSFSGIVTNNLNNIVNCKYTHKEWSSIIKDDKDIAKRVMNVMIMLGIIEIPANHKKLKLNYRKLDEFGEGAFDDEELKKKVIFNNVNISCN